MSLHHCLTAVTVIENTAIKERNKKNPVTDLQESFIEAMQKSVLKPLCHDCEAEEFRKNISDSETRLAKGLIRGVRELEVMLTTSTKVRARGLIQCSGYR